MKRAFDIIAALCLLSLLWPFMLIMYFLIRRKLGTPVIYRQERPGLHGTPFVIYKFRTMSEERDEEGNLLPDHLRLSSFGNILRKYSIDELPQLVNVVKGDLSFVGPRPLAMEYLPLYTPFQARRHEVKPGITGWAQVHGRNSISWEERFELDVWYVDNRSSLLDFKIIFLTIIKVIKSEGISGEGHVTMPDFEGTKRSS